MSICFVAYDALERIGSLIAAALVPVLRDCSIWLYPELINKGVLGNMSHNFLSDCLTFCFLSTSES